MNQSSLPLDLCLLGSQVSLHPVQNNIPHSSPSILPFCTLIYAITHARPVIYAYNPLLCCTNSARVVASIYNAVYCGFPVEDYRWPGEVFLILFTIFFS